MQLDVPADKHHGQSKEVGVVGWMLRLLYQKGVLGFPFSHLMAYSSLSIGSKHQWALHFPWVLSQPSVPPAQAIASNNDRRIINLEAKVASLENKQDKLAAQQEDLTHKVDADGENRVLD